MTATLIVPLLIQENNNHKQRYPFIWKSRCKKMEIMAGRHLRLCPSSCNPVIYLFHIRQRRPTKHTNQFDDGFKIDNYVQIKITSMPELLTLLKTQYWSNCVLNLVSTQSDQSEDPSSHVSRQFPISGVQSNILKVLPHPFWKSNILTNDFHLFCTRIEFKTDITLWGIVLQKMNTESMSQKNEISHPNLSYKYIFILL